MAAERDQRRLPPPWVGHLLVFGLLAALVLAWFVVQTRQAQHLFLDDASEHARLLTDAVILHARGARLAEEATEAILTRFLESSAHFVDYLDGIAPFRADELTGFAAETGLSVIRIVRPGGSVQGPADWAPDQPLGCDRLDRLIRLRGLHKILLAVASRDRDGCVIVGMDSDQIERLESAIGVSRALESVAGLRGVVAVRLEPVAAPPLDTALPAKPPPAVLQERPGGQTVARASGPVDGAQLLLDLDAEPLMRMRQRLWLGFAGFALVLVLTGVLGAWVLYRHQRAHERQRVDYERRLSRQREEAGLGRAAASIAHEIRNPLNAMAMGLQRLQIEADELTGEHRRLIGLVLQAVGRANGTVTGLLDYARPVKPKRQRVLLDRLVSGELTLYQPSVDAAGARVRADLQPDTWVVGDPALLAQVLDNLLRNALEAIPRGETLEVSLTRDQGQAWLCVTNPGLTLEACEVERILEPWFTTKPTGAGLGLALCQRILSAQGGRLSLDVPRPGWLSVRVGLPSHQAC